MCLLANERGSQIKLTQFSVASLNALELMPQGT